MKDVGIFYGHLVHLQRSFVIFYGHLV
jgi:hypothetical protein